MGFFEFGNYLQDYLNIYIYILEKEKKRKKKEVSLPKEGFS